MGKVIQFPQRDPDEFSAEGALRMLCSASKITQRFSPDVQKQAIKNVLVGLQRWWPKTIPVNVKPQVDFSEQQAADVMRIIHSVIEATHSTCRGRFLGERLTRELEIESERARLRAV